MHRRKFLLKSLAVSPLLLPFSLTRFNRQEEDRPKPLKTDTHVHLFNLNRFDYPWLDSAPEIRLPYDIHAYQKASRKARIGKFVFMESGAIPEQSLEEIQWVIEQAAFDQRLVGIIARGDIDVSGHIYPAIDRLTQTDWVKGIRGRIHKELLQSDGFIRGMNKLAKKNLSVDLLLRPPLYTLAFQALKKCPDTLFILDHVGNPNIKDGDISAWKQGINQLAEIPNLHCKISGVISGTGDKWSVDTLKPYVFHVIEKFGFNRIIYGSDWPNSLRFSDHYMDWTRVFEKITQSFSENELEKLYHQNADRIYRLM